MPSLKPSSDIRTFFARTAENQREQVAPEKWRKGAKFEV